MEWGLGDEDLSPQALYVEQCAGLVFQGLSLNLISS